MRLAAALLPLLLCAAAADEYDPIAAPGATVTLGRARLTVLTPHLIRFEVSAATGGDGAAAFDDRATTVVVNRRLPVPPYTVTPINATAATVSTSALTITLVGGKEGPYCSLALNGTDALAPVRSQGFPNGTAAATQAACCAACQGDPTCASWVYAPGAPRGANCWPLSSLGGTAPAAGRVLGGASAAGASLTVRFTGPGGAAASWTPAAGTADAQNLNGTYHALDCYSTPMECNDVYVASMGAGLLSRSGWAALEETATARLVAAPDAPAGMPTWWDTSGTRLDALDVYFMARGDSNYRAALGEWAAVLGRPAMLPRSAFGVWWSRYWPYSQQSIVEEVLAGYANYSIPLSNLVLDMDWHNEPKDKTCQSWGNYDVNTTLFPDMAGWAARLHAFGDVTGNPLKLSFNVHPQTGVDHCDSRYAAIASAMGIDPASQATVPCDFGNKTFTDALFSTYYDAPPLHAVDAWWTDYGGCGGPPGEAQLWSNRVFYGHQKYARGTRGQAFSRYGGLGNHLAPHGFSGDTFQHEVVLAWQVKTTQTAANVLWGYWSHDIGGFHSGQGAPGDADPANTTGAELLLRWVQFGAVAPILRTHCDHCERRIWEFPYFEQMRDAMRLRSALAPYLYTEARAFYDTAVAPVHPLYYDAPGDEALYGAAVVDSQYAFGSAVLAAPVTATAGAPQGTLNTPIARAVYLPSGAWVTWNGSLATATGGVTDSRLYGVGDIPLFARGGALLPLATMASVAGAFPSPLVWAAFPGAPAGAYALYEDDGDSDAYQGGQYVRTAASVAWGAGGVTLRVAPASASGALPAGFPQQRAHALQVRGGAGAGRGVAGVTVNGAPVPPAAPGVAPGWSVVQEAQHTLAAPAGCIVVQAGLHSSWAALEVAVAFQ